MDPQLIARIKNDPKYGELVAKRWSFARLLAVAMLAIYFGFVLLVAFAKPFLSTPIGGGVTTIGIPLGVFVIVSAFVLTGLYVRRANGEFDQLTKAIIEGAKK
jgi:uncharacterized membrane protein (DUF485 family)